jgi:hypothetical protein
VLFGGKETPTRSTGVHAPAPHTKERDEAVLNRLCQEVTRPIHCCEFQTSCAMGGFVLPTSLGLEEHAAELEKFPSSVITPS